MISGLGLGLGLGLETSGLGLGLEAFDLGLGLETPRLVNIPDCDKQFWKLFIFFATVLIKLLCYDTIRFDTIVCI